MRLGGIRGAGRRRSAGGRAQRGSGTRGRAGASAAARSATSRSSRSASRSASDSSHPARALSAQSDRSARASARARAPAARQREQAGPAVVRIGPPPHVPVALEHPQLAAGNRDVDARDGRQRAAALVTVVLEGHEQRPPVRREVAVQRGRRTRAGVPADADQPGDGGGQPVAGRGRDGHGRSCLPDTCRQQPYIRLVGSYNETRVRLATAPFRTATSRAPRPAGPRGCG